jgi:hypothetical protein
VDLFAAATNTRCTTFCSRHPSSQAISGHDGLSLPCTAGAYAYPPFSLLRPFIARLRAYAIDRVPILAILPIGVLSDLVWWPSCDIKYIDSGILRPPYNGPPTPSPLQLVALRIRPPPSS